MDVNEQITKTMESAIAEVFQRDEADIAAHHDLRMREDLGSSSKHYFPIIAAIEDDFGIMIDYHMFQYSATTVQSAIDYVIDEYHKQKGM